MEPTRIRDRSLYVYREYDVEFNESSLEDRLLMNHGIYPHIQRTMQFDKSMNETSENDDEPEHECPDCGSANTEPSAETRLEYKCRDCGTAFDLSGGM